jgi:polysaccharide deacetylase family protein (PEP-CTERM system associated)
MNTIKKYAILSMDVEDWYHLDYFQEKNPDKTKSMLDGFINYIDLLNSHKIKTTFFALSEISGIAENHLKYAVECGHEIACHGKTHIRPLTLSIEEFEKEINEAKDILTEVVGKEVIGYRAPCYSIDNERYEIVKKLGFKYSSSKMDVPNHPLYGDLNLSGFNCLQDNIYEKDGFMEFALSTKKLFGKHIAVSGGGWIRLFPWHLLMKPMIKSYIESANTYTLYIHPFELSNRQMPKIDDINFLTHIRSRFGIGKVSSKINTLISLLKDNGFWFDTFNNVREELINKPN